MKIILLAGFLSLPILSFAQETAVEDAEPATFISLPDHEEIVIRGKSIEISNSAIQPDWIANYAELSPDLRENFQTNRKLFLTGIARILTRMSLPVGVGGIMKDKLVWIKNSLVDKLKGKQNAEVPEELETAVEKNWRARAEIVTKNILNGVNNQLWARAPLVSHSNEFGVVGSAGLALEGGVASKGWGGLYDLGLSFGFNKETKAVVFQIFRNQEKYASTIMGAVFYAGSVFKGGIYVAENSGAKAVLPKRGNSYYPPGFPGFSTDTSHSFASGMSSGVGWPPPPLGDLLTYSNTHEQQVLLRLSFSPIMPGFLRLSFGKGRGPLALLQPIEDVIRLVHSLLIRAPICNGVLLAD